MLEARARREASNEQERQTQLNEGSALPRLGRAATPVSKPPEWNAEMEAAEAEEGSDTQSWTSQARRQNETWRTEEVSPSYSQIEPQRHQATSGSDRETDRAYHGLNLLAMAQELEVMRGKLADSERRVEELTNNQSRDDDRQAEEARWKQALDEQAYEARSVKFQNTGQTPTLHPQPAPTTSPTPPWMTQGLPSTNEPQTVSEVKSRPSGPRPSGPQQPAGSARFWASQAVEPPSFNQGGPPRYSGAQQGYGGANIGPPAPARSFPGLGRADSYSRPLAPKPLTSDEIKAHRFLLKPELIVGWWQTIYPFLTSKVPELEPVLTCGEDEWELAIKHEPVMRAANEWLATQLFTILRADAGLENSNFLADLRREDPGAFSDGRKLARLVLEARHAVPGGDELQRLTQFDELCAKSFQLGSSLEQVRSDAHKILDMWETLPPQQKSREHDVLYRLIEAMPTEQRRIKEKRVELHLELRVAHVHSRPAPWTTRQLVDIIGVHLTGGLHIPVPGRPGGREAHLADEEPRGGGGPPRGAQREMKCVKCGQLGHGWRDCNKTCRRCGEANCPGNHGKACILTYKVWPAGKISNALGNPVPRFAMSELQERWRKDNPGGKEQSPAQSQGRGWGEHSKGKQPGRASGRGKGKQAAVAEQEEQSEPNSEDEGEAESLVMEFSMLEMEQPGQDSPQAQQPGLSEQDGREGEEQTRSLEPRPFPSVGGASTLEDWLAMGPGAMCGSVQHLGWDEVWQAMQAIRIHNPLGHLAHRCEPESLLRAHLCSRLRDLFDPAQRHHQAQLRARAEAAQPEERSGPEGTTAEPTSHCEAPYSDESDETEWSGGRDSNGRNLTYQEGQERLKTRLEAEELCELWEEAQEAGDEGLFGTEDEPAEEPDSASTCSQVEAGAAQAQKPLASEQPTALRRRLPRAAKAEAGRELSQQLELERRGERQDERASEQAGRGAAGGRGRQLSQAKRSGGQERPEMRLSSDSSASSIVILEGTAVQEQPSDAELNVAEFSALPETVQRATKVTAQKQFTKSCNELFLDGGPEQPDLPEEAALISFGEHGHTIYLEARPQEEGQPDWQAAVLELEAAQATVERPKPGGATMEFLVDSGANFSMVTRPVAGAEVTSRAREVAHGAFGQSGFAIDLKQSCTAELIDEEGTVLLSAPLEVAVVGSGRRNILSASQIIKQWRAYPNLRTMKLELPGKAEAPVSARNGLYYLKAQLRPSPPPQPAWTLTERALAYSAARPFGGKLGEQAVLRAHLWAARMHAAEQALRKVSKLNVGTGLPEVLSQEQVQGAISDTFLRRANLRRGHVARKEREPCECGERWQIDFFGPSQAKSPLDGAKYHLHAQCAGCDFSRDASTNKANLTVLKAFGEHIVAEEAKLGHVVKELRVDADPKLALGQLRAHFEPKGVTVAQAAGGFHEGIQSAEAATGPVQRAAMAEIARAGLSNGHLIPAMMYASYKRRYKESPRHPGKSRELVHTGRQTNLEKMPPYCYGTTMAYVADKQERGSKGRLDTTSPKATLVGCNGAAYTLLKSNGEKVVRAPEHVIALNERALVERGTPRVAGSEPEQREGGATARQAQAAAPGSPGEGQGEELEPDSAFEQHCRPADRGPPSRRTRARGKDAVLEQLAAALEPAANQAEAASMFDAFTYQLGDGVNDQFGVDYPDELGEKVDAFITHINQVAERPRGEGSMEALHVCHLEACKAKQTYTEVMTKAGPASILVPATTAEVLASPHREQWLGADRRALDVILAAGNSLRRVKDVLAEGHEIYDSVTIRKLKLDRVTRFLLDLNGFKSRINLNGEQQKAVQAKRGTETPRGAHAAVADDTSIKFVKSLATEYKLVTIIADLPNAYCSGERRRPPTAMRVPRTLDIKDEEGEQMCVWLVTPVYGEAQSGDELDATVSSFLETAGWVQLDVNPAMRTFHCPVGPSVMLVTVDDIMMVTPEGTEHGERTAAELEKAFGPGVVVKRGKEASEYAGYTFAESDDRSRCTLRMEMHVDDAVARFEPGLLQGVRPSAELPAQQRRGALARMCERLVLPPADERQPRLTPEQTYFQEVTGAARYFERVKPRLTYFLWRFSRVSSYPFPIDVAKMCARLLLELAYDTKSEGITFGGEGAVVNPRLAAHFHGELDLDEPSQPDLEAHADTTWNCNPDAFAVVIMRNRGAVSHGVWRMTLTCDSSQLAEAVGSSRAAEKLVAVREMERGVGVAADVPPVLTTDSSSNWQVATRHASASRSRHALRRWRTLTQRIAEGDLKMIHIDGAIMPADFLTKKVEQKKVDRSVAFATNVQNVVAAVSK